MPVRVFIGLWVAAIVLISIFRRCSASCMVCAALSAANSISMGRVLLVANMCSHSKKWILTLGLLLMMLLLECHCYVANLTVKMTKSKGDLKGGWSYTFR